MKITKGEAIGFLDKCRYWFMPYTSEEDTWNEALDMAIEALQTEVVRCKDCEHRDEKCGMGEHRWCKILKMSTVPNGFCSYGEPKGGEK